MSLNKLVKIEQLKDKLTLRGDLIADFKNFIKKIDEESIDFILNNFDFIGWNETSHHCNIPKEKRSLTFKYGSTVVPSNLDCPVEIRLPDYRFHFEIIAPKFYIPSNISIDDIVIKFYNREGIVALVDARGNLFCAYLPGYSQNSEGHLLLQEVIKTYKKFDFPIANYTEAILHAKFVDIEKLTTDMKIEVKVYKKKVDKRKLFKLLKPELVAIENSLRAKYETIIAQKNEEIEKLKKEIEKVKEDNFLKALSFIEKFNSYLFKIKIEKGKILVDCSRVVVNRIKKDNLVYELRGKYETLFRIGTIVIPFNAKKLKDCYAIDAFHPNIHDDGEICFGELHSLDDIADGIGQLQTINLDNCFENRAAEEALKVFEIVKKENNSFIAQIWKSD